jgi:Rrf2 family transcriptional regulator, cysteine metabolism repressor
MFKVSTKSRYGLRAMVCLAKSKKEICSLKEISRKERISFDYLEKIVSRLEKNGLLKSKRGSKGGYFLAKHPQKIKIGEIIRAVEGDALLVKCITKSGHCSIINKCVAKKFWNKLQKSLNTALDSLTLADLIK